MTQALVPMVRLYLKSGLGAGDFTIAAKLAFIRVAAENARIGGRINFSAISAMTGLTRKEVRTLVSQVNEGAAVPNRNIARQRTARVIHGWKTDPAFLDNNGNPAVLPLHGQNVSFAMLVRRYGGDVTPVSVLKELERGGAVRRSKSGTLRLRKQSTRMKGYGSEALAEVTGRVHDLAATMVSNVERVDRPVYTGFQDIPALPVELATLFQSIFSERAAALLEGVDRWAATQAKLRKPDAGSEPQSRVGIGIYLIDEPENQDNVRLLNALPKRRRRKVPPVD
jgi:Family of unknown function (DUF6502)